MMDNKHTHPECLMQKEWAILRQKINSDFAKIKEAILQVEKEQNRINQQHLLMITDLIHRVTGNKGAGLESDVRINRQTAQSGLEAVESSVRRLWYAMGLVISLLIANLGMLMYGN